MNMKKLLGAATALSMVMGSTVAMAGPSDKVVYGAQINIGPFSFPANVAIDTSGPVGQNIVNGPILGFLPGTDAIRNSLPEDQRGARYAQTSNVSGDVGTASTTAGATFNLSGTVNKDCSFYSGDSGANSTQNINLGTIGIQAGNNVNNTAAFDQVSAITANVNTSTAGCNTNNTVTITKTNGAVGLLNSTPGNFDQASFTDRIPYSVKATWFGVPTGNGGPVAGSNQTLDVSTSQGTNNKAQGAWRSSFNLDIDAPNQGKGLVAGTYKDSIQVTLAAAI